MSAENSNINVCDISLPGFPSRTKTDIELKHEGYKLDKKVMVVI